MGEITMNGIYLGQSGFLLEFLSATLIFDWVYGTLPPVRTDMPLYVFLLATSIMTISNKRSFR